MPQVEGPEASPRKEASLTPGGAALDLGWRETTAATRAGTGYDAQLYLRSATSQLTEFKLVHIMPRTQTCRRMIDLCTCTAAAAQQGAPTRLCEARRESRATGTLHRCMRMRLRTCLLGAPPCRRRARILPRCFCMIVVYKAYTLRHCVCVCLCMV